MQVRTAVRIGVMLPLLVAILSGQILAAAGRPPTADSLLDEDRLLDSNIDGSSHILLQSRWFTQLIALQAACAAAKRIASAPLDASLSSRTLSSLSRYTALCGTNAPSEILAFQSSAVALQSFSLSLQSVSLRDRAEEQKKRTISINGEIGAQADASLTDAQAVGKVEAKGRYEDSQEFQAVVEREISQQRLSIQETSEFQSLFTSLLDSQTSLEGALLRLEVLISKAIPEIEGSLPAPEKPQSLNPVEALRELKRDADQRGQQIHRILDDLLDKSAKE